MTAFPINLQGGRLGVVRLVKDLKSICDNPHKRFFVEQNEIIKTSTEDCAVCTQWGIGNINQFIERARKLGMVITPIKN